MCAACKAKDLNALASISGNVRYGTLEGFDDSGGIAIGTRLANSLNVFVGGEVSILAPRGASTPFGTAPRVKRYPVKAIFEMGMSEYDNTIAFMPLKEAQSYLQPPGAVHVLELVLNDPDTVDTMRGALQDAAGPDILLSDWRQRNATFYNTLKVERNVMFIIVMLIVLVATLNIVSGLTMLVKNKGRDIAVLRTMGATRGAIMRVFFISGTSIGFSAHFWARPRRLRKHASGGHPGIPLLAAQHAAVRPAGLLPVEAAIRAGPGGGCRRGDGFAFALDGCNDLSRAASRAARPCGGFALRMTQLGRDFAGTRPVLQVVSLTRTYVQGDRELQCCAAPPPKFLRARSVALVGPSGSGKSSLLHMAGLLEKPGAGSVLLNGVDCTAAFRQRAHPGPAHANRLRLPVS